MGAEEPSTRARRGDGLRHEESKRYYELNRDEIRRRERERQAAKDPLVKRAQLRAYREAHKDRIAEENKRFREKHRDHIAASTKAYRTAHPERVAANKSRWYQANKDAIREKKRSWVERTRPARLDHYLQVHYGISLNQYETLLSGQNNGCAICGGPPGGRWPRYHVDHDHTTGAIRGLLCNNCNLGLGKFKDDPTILARAITYLQEDPDD